MQGVAVWIFLGLIAVSALLGAFKGLRRGLFRQTIRTVTVAGAAALAIWLARIPYNKIILPFFEGKTTEQLVLDLQGRGIMGGSDLSWLYNFDAVTIKYLIALPIALILVPILFVILFAIIKLLMMIVHVCVSGLLGFSKSNNNFLTRILGAVIGAIQGVAVTVLMLMPIIGYADVYADTVSILNEEMPEDGTVISLTDTYNKHVKSFNDNFLTRAARACGVDTLFKYLSTVRVEEDVKITMTDKVPAVASIYTDIAKLRGADWNNPSAEQQSAIKSIIAKVDSDEYIANMISGALRGASKCYSSGIFGLSVPEPFGTLIDSAITVFHTSDRTNLSSDLNTFTDVYFVLAKDGVLLAFTEGADRTLDIISTRDENGNTPIKNVMNIIDQNPRIKPVNSMLAQLSVTLMANTMDLGENGAVLYDSVSRGLTATLEISKDGKTEEEYVSEVSASLNAVFLENNMEVEPEIVDLMARDISEKNLAESEEASTEDILLTYFDAYVDYKENGTLPDGFDTPES